MRKLVSWNLMTLDGYFEGAAPWSLEFHEDVWGDELQRFVTEQAAEVGTLVFGRATYEGMASYWRTARGATADFMNAVPKVVFSRTLTDADWSNTRLVTGDVAGEVERLKAEDGKDLFIFGSAALTDALTHRGLVDEYRIGLTPHVLGRGTPLFKPSDETLRLKLLEARPMTSGVVLLRYGRA